MSDEYGPSNYEGTLVNESIADSMEGQRNQMQQKHQSKDFAIRGYPPNGDTTSEGGSSDICSDEAQHNQKAPSTTGLLDQSISGGSLQENIQDAEQGKDEAAQEVYQG